MTEKITAKNDITEVVFILDASGSMYELTDDTIGGFNSMLDKQKASGNRVLVTTVTFNDTSRTLHDRIPIGDVPKMTRETYQASGCTALLDAMGDAIHKTMDIHKYIRPEDVPAQTLFVITTDGMENASRKYSSDEVKKLVEARTEAGWEFIFMGANIDAIETAKNYGIRAERAVNYVPDGIGTKLNFETVADAMCCVAGGAPLKDSWKDRIAADHKKRGRH